MMYITSSLNRYVTLFLRLNEISKRYETFQCILQNTGTEFGGDWRTRRHRWTTVDFYQPRVEIVGQHKISTVKFEAILESKKLVSGQFLILVSHILFDILTIKTTSYDTFLYSTISWLHNIEQIHAHFIPGYMISFHVLA